MNVRNLISLSTPLGVYSPSWLANVCLMRMLEAAMPGADLSLVLVGQKASFKRRLWVKSGYSLLSFGFPFWGPVCVNSGAFQF